jgi:hypothetical protein
MAGLTVQLVMVSVRVAAQQAFVAPSKVQNDGIKRGLMKFIEVTQQVQILSDQRLANRSEANPMGQPGNGSPELGGAREQAV